MGLSFVRISLNLISIAIIVIPSVTVRDIIIESIRAVFFEGSQGISTIGVIVSISITTSFLGSSNNLVLGDCSRLNTINNIVSISVIISSQCNSNFLLVIFVQGVHGGLRDFPVTPTLFVSISLQFIHNLIHGHFFGGITNSIRVSIASFLFDQIGSFVSSCASC